MTRPTSRHRPRKRFGQHFLTPSWSAKVVAAIRPADGDVFLEIGPGQGAITLPLAATGAPILAVEIDRDLVASLAERIPRNVTLMSGDVLTTDFVPFLGGLGGQLTPDQSLTPRPSRRVRVVGNLPYNLTSPILLRLAQLQEHHGLFHDATLMVQREVADRITARPGSRDYGVLTVTLQLVGAAQRLLDLPPGAFRPPPKVKSTVVGLRFGAPPVRVDDRRLFSQVVKAAFGKRRKMLGNALAALVPKPAALLAEAGIDPRRRAETLSLDDLSRLTTALARARRPPVL